MRMAKKTELKKEYGHDPIKNQVNNSLTSTLARHCRQRTIGVEETYKQIQNFSNARNKTTIT